MFSQTPLERGQSPLYEHIRIISSGLIFFPVRYNTKCKTQTNYFTASKVNGGTRSLLWLPIVTSENSLTVS